MNTLILKETARLLFVLILLFSLSALLRGHNQVGGGFVGGLIASIACSLYVFVADAADVRRLLRADPLRIAAAGLSLAILSGVVGMYSQGSSFLTGVWVEVLGIKVGTPLLFDCGVYLVVVGAVLTFVLEAKEPVVPASGDSRSAGRE
ncbi:MAG: hypothetical protein OXN89_14410 [Bryobacterales bacterium]|nr:hypothetical protein [Bryobacterales bacterium]